ncbi:hypothetical protein ES676_06110 [Bizionia saleffrena]|uniref:Uncharacterized protein n=1 Tax=Bizionia saleffrena TaxID=291189 RepID=A0A8H2LD85_9FLAO|nr:hypothetical protein [Bizionia saleffrena]TYB76023.1 hypothetical protein ES676_06110 [Bizionia saleffrena]
MTVLEQFFFSVFSHFKGQFKQKANTIALVYISALEIAIMFVLGCFFAAFLSQLNSDVMSSDKGWTLFVLIAIGIHFKNWIKYGGKKRKVMNAKFNRKKTAEHNIVLLLLLPFICLGFGLLLLQAV